MHNCALEFDPTRSKFPIWCGGPTIWNLQEPTANTTSGWTVVQQPPPVTGSPSTAVQALDIMGKWRYAPYFDVFVALENEFDGNVWIYKPIGWSQPNVPGNPLPTVSVLTPSAGSTIQPGATVNLTATASDNGSIARVEYYVNGQKMGQATAAPYTVPIMPVLVGSYTVIAVAVDNVGGMGKSAPVTFNVNATLTTTVLQRGLNGYTGVTDTFLDGFQKTLVHGASDPLYLDQVNYNPLLRFAIFQSEGGPVPNGAVLQSATLTLNKQYYSDDLQLNSLLVPWTETDATWTNRQAGVPWSLGGAANPGVDYVSAPDALLSAPSYNPGPVAFDVTARVQQWSNGSGSNYGWRMMQASAGINPKQFTASENASTAQRPSLTIVWSGGGGGGNPPPTVSITNPPGPTTITLGASITLNATASDDGSVTQVAYFANGAPIGQATVSPYPVTWTPAAVGNYTLTAVATDNLSATTTSSPVVVTVNPSGGGGTTVVLQRGLSGYAGVSDTFLDNQQQTTSRGAFDPLYLDVTKYMPLVRFSIFQSEGGPVPDGATIQTATLGLYKQLYNDTIRLNALLKPWVESQATWLNSRTGVPWSSPGAASAGSDYVSAADALVAAPYAAGVVNFDVTTRVQQWSGAPAANYGWRMSQTTTGYNPKTFVSSEDANAAQRPKLTVVYTGGGGGGNVPPTVSIATPGSGASITIGASFSLTASATDSDGSVAKVEYFANGTSVGFSTSAGGGFPVSWTPAATGSYTLTAVATDNLNAPSAPSAGIPVSVNASTTTTVVLQRGLNGYAGVADTFLDSQLQTTVRGSYTPLYLDVTKYLPLVRFAVFQSEGGPVPNSATILSATLSLDKGLYNDTIRVNALLKPWVEGQATWLNSQTGVPWTSPGASGIGSDYSSSADALVAAPYAAGWVNFDVTNRVQNWGSGNGLTNNGWRLSQTTSGYNPKTFYSSEYTPDTTLRPKLTIVYQ
jgi:hypothetical protein